MKILIVDDIGYSRLSLQMLLVRAGHDVIEMESGEEAFATLKSDHAIKVVITDLLMPGMDGVDLFIHTQSLERFDDQGQVDSPAFILLTTAHEGRPGTDRETMIRLELASNIGFTEMLTKPVDQQLLLQILERIRTKEESHTADVSRSAGATQDIMNATTPPRNSRD